MTMANTQPAQYNAIPSPHDPKRPSFRTPHTMDPRTWLRDLTPYFLYILFIATLGPLLFGFHLVSLPPPYAPTDTNRARAS
jgi:hypothetical protein